MRPSDPTSSITGENYPANKEDCDPGEAKAREGIVQGKIIRAEDAVTAIQEHLGQNNPDEMLGPQTSMEIARDIGDVTDPAVLAQLPEDVQVAIGVILDKIGSGMSNQHEPFETHCVNENDGLTGGLLPETPEATAPVETPEVAAPEAEVVTPNIAEDDMPTHQSGQEQSPGGQVIVTNEETPADTITGGLQQDADITNSDVPHGYDEVLPMDRDVSSADATHGYDDAPITAQAQQPSDAEYVQTLEARVEAALAADDAAIAAANSMDDGATAQNSIAMQDLDERGLLGSFAQADAKLTGDAGLANEIANSAGFDFTGLMNVIESVLNVDINHDGMTGASQQQTADFNSFRV